MKSIKGHSDLKSICSYISEIEAIDMPDCKTPEGVEVVRTIEEKVAEICFWIISEARKML